VDIQRAIKHSCPHPACQARLITVLKPEAPAPSVDAQPEQFTCPACGLTFPFAVPSSQVAYIDVTLQDRRDRLDRPDRDVEKP
jgi:hypothetical protein